jgi:hypothetical protein
LSRSGFGEPMAGGGIKIEIVKFLQILDALSGTGAEGVLAIKGVEHNPLQKIAQRHIVILGQSFKDFNEPLFHADSGLNTLDNEFSVLDHGASVFNLNLSAFFTSFMPIRQRAIPYLVPVYQGRNLGAKRK